MLGFLTTSKKKKKLKAAESQKIDACCGTYTQIYLHSQTGNPVEPSKHGGNRDSLKCLILDRHFAIAVVCDGAGLLFWSEVEAVLATEKFCEFWKDWFEKNKMAMSPMSPKLNGGSSSGAPVRFDDQLIRQTLVDSILATNKQIMRLGNQDLLELAGQTTLSACILYLDKENANWSVASTGIGDSPIFKWNSKESKWETLFFDAGEMLPFLGLGPQNIPTPVISRLEVGDLLLLSSDGIISSLERSPEYGGEDLLKKRTLKVNLKSPTSDLNASLSEMLELTNKIQTEFKGDPDDVAMVVLGISSPPTPSASSDGTLLPLHMQTTTTSFIEIDVQDLTTKLNVNFKNNHSESHFKVDLPIEAGGSYFYPGDGKINVSKRKQRTTNLSKSE